MAFVRLVVIGLIVMTAAYFMISLYSRSVRREKLEKEFAEEYPNRDEAARNSYVAEGMEKYESSLRPKLILLVYVVPVVLIAGIHIMTTYY